MFYITLFSKTKKEKKIEKQKNLNHINNHELENDKCLLTILLFKSFELELTTI